MIGVIPKADQLDVVEEFFELFKTPWEFYRPGRAYDLLIVTTGEVPDAGAKLVLLSSSSANRMDARLGVSGGALRSGAILNGDDTPVPVYGDLLALEAGTNGCACVMAAADAAGVRVEMPGTTVIRLGYDLFDEVRRLLTAGQPVEFAHIPTLDIHVRMVRQWMLDAGLSFVEIPPVPAEYDFIGCLTHDIDFIGIRQHLLDHSMWGFLYRATAGSLLNFLRRRLALGRLVRSWKAAASLPLVYLGLAKDFWDPFPWYLKVEEGLPATYFLIPFKRRPGEKVPGRQASYRGTAYDVGDLAEWTPVLQEHGCELGVHGLDAWHNAEKGREERSRIEAVADQPEIGIRMHWLLHSEETPSVLEQAGYSYDSTCGYNETPGYRAGTGQVFRPLGVKKLLELPMHIQDGALFFHDRLNLPEPEADQRCQVMIGHALRHGGVLTLLWHDRSHGPERFWGEFYAALVQKLKSMRVWFGTAGQVTGWFRQRRSVQLEEVGCAGGVRIRLRCSAGEVQPPLRIRLHGQSQGGSDPTEISWDGISPIEVELPSAIPACHPL